MPPCEDVDETELELGNISKGMPSVADSPVDIAWALVTLLEWSRFLTVATKSEGSERS